MKSKFAITYECKEAKYQDGSIATEAGTWVWVHRSEWGPTSAKYMDKDPVWGDGDLWIFDTEKEANAFAKKYRGHPWWYTKKGQNYKIVELVPRMVMVQKGWEIKE